MEGDPLPSPPGPPAPPAPPPAPAAAAAAIYAAVRQAKNEAIVLMCSGAHQ